MKKGSPIDSEALAQAMCVVLLVVIALKAVAVWRTCDQTGQDSWYTYRHIIFILVWCMLLYFFYIFFMFKRIISPLLQNFKEMEHASLLAFIGCVIKFVTSAIYIYTSRISVAIFTWTTAYYVGELLVWLVLSAFMFHFWRSRVEIRRMVQEDELED